MTLPNNLGQQDGEGGQPYFSSDKRILAKLGVPAPSTPAADSTAQALDPPAVPPVETPPADAGVTTAPPVQADPATPTEPETAGVAEGLLDGDFLGDLSFDLPDDAPDTTVTAAAVTPFDQYKPAEGSPSWQLDAWNRIVADPTLSDQDKAAILEQKPHAWDKVKYWNAAGKTIGKFRDNGFPISDVLKELSQIHPSRTQELVRTSVSTLVKDGEQLVRFAEENPQEYAGFVRALAESAPEYVAKVLGKSGYAVVKAEPVSSEAILQKLRSNPHYDSIVGTELEEDLVAQLTSLAEQAAAAASTPLESLTESTPEEPAPNVDIQAAQASFRQVHDTMWVKAAREGAVLSGIRPATKTEVAANPAAHLKTILHAVAVHGLPEVIPSLDEVVDRFGESQYGYDANVKELQQLLVAGDIKGFEEKANQLTPVYFELGRRRAMTPAIAKLYKMVEQFLASAAAPPVTPQQQPASLAPGIETPDTVSESTGTVKAKPQGFVSDRRVLQRLGIEVG